MKYRVLLFAFAAFGVAMTALHFYSQRRFDLPPIDSAKETFVLAQKLTSLHSQMGPTQSGDWLEAYPENGQSFGEYTRVRHVRLTEDRNVLYVLPLGEFNEKQMKIVELSAQFLGKFFMCDVKTLDVQNLDVIPQEARRVNPHEGMRQINSKYVLEKVLPDLLPDDAVALIAFTTSDLYPQDSWNFVFGQASLQKRVGVWSLFRNGNPETEFETVLRRTLKTASHETGHMFSILHCTHYECGMCGSNNRPESDRHPLYFCPQCVAKVWWSTDCDPVKRFKSLQAFCAEHSLLEEADFYQKSLERIQ